MRLSIVNVLFPVFLLALSVIGSPALALDRDDEIASDIFLSDFDADAEWGASSYVEATETTLFIDFAPYMCAEEEDGSWSADAPEGIFSHDQPDEDSPHPLYLWKLVLSPSQPPFELVATSRCSLQPGALYPPPQQ